MQRGSPPFISGSLSVPLVAARGLAVGGGSSHFHTAPVNPSQEELAGTELMGPACVEVLPNYPQKPWALLGTPKPSHLQGPRKGQPEATAGIPRGLTERAWPRPRGAAPRGQ